MRIKKFIKQQSPYAILSWRYLCPGQNEAVRMHKKVLLHAWPDKPRVIWLVIALFSYTKWFFFLGWLKLWKVWKKRSPVLQKKNGISRNKQFFGLLKLAFLQTTPPHVYYSYRLYRYSTLEWLNFIYNHELPNWHLVMSPGISIKTSRLLADKAAFAQEMQKQGFPVIDGVVIPKGCCLSKEQLFQHKSLFLKPLCGNRKTGAYELRYYATGDNYSLFVSEDEQISNPEAILSFLQSLAKQQDYLVQPLLQNHPDLQKLSEYHSLVTFRVITIWRENKAQVISAVIEFPVNNSSEYVYPFPVDLQNGTIIPEKEKTITVKQGIESKFKHIPGHQLPHWHELIDSAQKAHAVFPDLFSIGWDFAVTPEGVKLIEGNINWAVNAHQMNAPYLMPIFVKYAQTNSG